MLQLGSQELSIYGLMKTMGRTQIRAVIEHFEAEGYLTTETEHQTVRLTRKCPRTIAEFKRVSGVGELKASWYGKASVNRIREYLEAQ